MKKLLGIVVLGLLLSGNAYAEIYLLCSNDGGSSITLSLDKKNNSGKEHVGGGSSIPYDLEISEASFFMQRYYEKKFVRSWNIDRYSGNASLNWKSNSKIKTSYWNCKKGSKKF